jgi:hypothetical protein
MEHLIHFLMPFFIGVAPSVEEARAEILETLASYGARTRQELLHAAQVIAFGLSALDALAEAKVTETSPSLRLRYRACANGLNRACQQNEKALASLQTCDIPDGADKAAAEPLNDLPEADFREAVRQAKAKIDTTANRLSGARSATRPGTGSAIFNALFEAVSPPSAAA